MTNPRSTRGRVRERGEGNARLIIVLLIIALAGYLGVQNAGTYLNVQNLKHDLAELARGGAAQRVPVDRIRRQAEAIAQKYDTRAEEVKVTNNGYNIKITVDSVKKIDLLVTTYDWHVQEELSGTAM
jgi:hypothetical protein